MTDANKRDQDIRLEDRENIVVDVIIVARSKFESTTIERDANDNIVHWESVRPRRTRGEVIQCAVVLTIGVAEAASGTVNTDRPSFKRRTGRAGDRASPILSGPECEIEFTVARVVQ